MSLPGLDLCGLHTEVNVFHLIKDVAYGGLIVFTR